MQHQQPPPLEEPTMDIGEMLRYLMGDTGDLQESLGGFKIRVHHVRGFPWGEVFKALVYRDFKVYVTRRKADLIIEANI